MPPVAPAVQTAVDALLALAADPAASRRARPSAATPLEERLHLWLQHVPLDPEDLGVQGIVHPGDREGRAMVSLELAAGTVALSFDAVVHPAAQPLGLWPMDARLSGVDLRACLWAPLHGLSTEAASDWLDDRLRRAYDPGDPGGQPFPRSRR